MFGGEYLIARGLTPSRVSVHRLGRLDPGSEAGNSTLEGAGVYELRLDSKSSECSQTRATGSRLGGREFNIEEPGNSTLEGAGVYELRWDSI